MLNVKKVKTKLRLFICLPSYNEAKHIRTITQKVDKALKKLQTQYDCRIINADNNSEDGTNNIFNLTKTKCKKISLISKNKGKGANIINFMKYFKNNNGDYAMMFDTDLKSFNSKWIYKMLKQLNKGKDFIFPLYKRTRYEGNTTNHFVVPILYSITGKRIRQPIGGDYAFNKKYVETFLKQKIETQIIEYGIDIFMISLVFKYNLKYTQINLGKKIHSSSYTKMEKIFFDVAKSLQISFKDLKMKDITTELELKYNSINKKRRCKFKNRIIECNNYRYKKICVNVDEYEKVKQIWKEELLKYIKNLEQNNQSNIDKMKDIFMCYVLSYWKNFDKRTAKECEESIWDFAENIRNSKKV